MAKFTTVGLGELLWDILPGSRQLGGAPANFAYMTNLLGDEGVVASRVGNDELGRETLHRLKILGLNMSHIQIDPDKATGVARVKLGAEGLPTFAFEEPSAWDGFEWTPDWEALAKKADAICFGSLAQRSAQSRDAIQAFLKNLRAGTTRIFDVNLRKPFYSAEILAESAARADIIKLSHDELRAFMQVLNLSFQDEESAAQSLLSRFSAKLVCVTRGPNGSLLLTENDHHTHRGIPIKVADTVGAGDAFTAALVFHYLRGAPLPIMNEAANRMGAWVASQTGATPPPDNAQLEAILAAKT
ncbi:MAG TPA: carbohydrate kinase [Candidatus Acidoferrum sp.]|nr:carbohydrate kinase [Candidatus Acidoferrum sp.]